MDALLPIEEAGPEELRENGEEEYLMLRLRLSEGVTETDSRRRFGHSLPPFLAKKSRSTASVPDHQ